MPGHSVYFPHTLCRSHDAADLGHSNCEYWPVSKIKESTACYALLVKVAKRFVAFCAVTKSQRLSNLALTPSFALQPCTCVRILFLTQEL